jgi:predicted Zn finger-like uncharacterized protein
MPIIVACPQCTGQLRIADELVGRKVRCPACNHIFVGTSMGTPAPEAQPDAWQKPDSRSEDRPQLSLDLDPIESRTESRPQLSLDLDPMNSAESPAKPAPKPAAMDLPTEPEKTERLDPWKHLNLELDDKATPEDDAPLQPLEEPRERVPPVPPSSLKPKKAVELEVGDEEEESPRRPSRRDDDSPKRRRAQLADEHEDLRRCPKCDRMVFRDDRRCNFCDTRLPRDEDEDEDNPRRRRQFRRDTVPHRGGFVLTMGIISLAILPCYMCYILAPLFSLIGIICGIVAWVCGSNDLKKIQEGTIDPEGEGNTQAGYICGIIGTSINALILLACGAIIAVVTFTMYNASQNVNKAPPPVPRIAPAKKF